MLWAAQFAKCAGNPVVELARVSLYVIFFLDLLYPVSVTNNVGLSHLCDETKRKTKKKYLSDRSEGFLKNLKALFQGSLRNYVMTDSGYRM